MLPTSRKALPVLKAGPAGSSKGSAAAPQTQESPLALPPVQGIPAAVATLVAQTCITKGFHPAETSDFKVCGRQTPILYSGGYVALLLLFYTPLGSLYLQFIPLHLPTKKPP